MFKPHFKYFSCSNFSDFVNNLQFIVFLDSGFTARQDYFIHFRQSHLWGGAKAGDPPEKTPDNSQAELGLSHIWPELESKPKGEMTNDVEH